MTPQSEQDRYLAHFRLFEKGLNGEAAADIHRLRTSAIRRFAELGFPTTHNEEWRFTNIASIVRGDFEPVLAYANDGVTQKEINHFIFEGEKGIRLVFLNGHFSRELSTLSRLPAGARVDSLASVLRDDPGLAIGHVNSCAKFEDNAFIALNTAFLQDGAFISVPDGVAIEEPIHILYVATGRQGTFLIHPRNLILAGKGSRLSIAESYVSLAGNTYLTDTVSEIVVGREAVVEHDTLQEESAGAYHIGATHIELGAGSTFTSNSVALGGSIVRNNVTAVFGGEGSECTLNGLSLSTGHQLIDNHTTIDHAVPRCVSHELYKAILDGESRGVFNGKIFVRPDAQKTDAKQTNKSLLLSDAATIDTKPQLEIFADDVRCTHGATVGALDEEQVFYLRSRGIGDEASRDILTFAFAADVINRIHMSPLRGRLEGMIRARLRQGRLTNGQ